MKSKLLLSTIILLLLSCNDPKTKKINGIFCASVEYFYPKTESKSVYRLEVNIEDDKLTQIFWPNGGWLDDTHFTPPTVVNENIFNFKSKKGIQYKIKIDKNLRECQTVNGLSENDFIEIEDKKICPICKGKKNQHDKYCSKCSSAQIKKQKEKEKKKEIYAFGKVDYKHYLIDYNHSGLSGITKSEKFVGIKCDCSKVFKISKHKTKDFKNQFYSSSIVQSNFNYPHQRIIKSSAEIKTFNNIDDATNYQMKKCNNINDLFSYF